MTHACNFHTPVHRRLPCRPFTTRRCGAEGCRTLQIVPHADLTVVDPQFIGV
jgi:hypothetical protein